MLSINVAAPWFAVFDPQLLAQCSQINWVARFNQALAERVVRSASGLQITLVAQSELPERQAYETFIFRTGKIPTRNNLHDFFNALLWLHLPRSKARLNALQAQAIAQQGIGAQRGALRDFCTLLDENGLLLVAPERARQALRMRDWQALLVDERQRWSCEIFAMPFGHALLEKLVQPYKAITAHCVVLPKEEFEPRNIYACFGAKMPEKAHEYCTFFDEVLTNYLEQNALVSTAHLQPLPVLGIPGWWPANVDPTFYCDAQVFRAPR